MQQEEGIRVQRGPEGANEQDGDICAEDLMRKWSSVVGMVSLKRDHVSATEITVRPLLLSHLCCPWH